MTVEHFDPGLLRNRDLLYFGLHGIPDQPWWYGTDLVSALHVDAFCDLDLHRTVVFCGACHLPDTPFLDAILHCRPRLLIGGAGENLTRGHSLVGAHLLGYLFVRAWRISRSPASAFKLAKHAVKIRTVAARAALVREKDPAVRRRLAENLKANVDAVRFSTFT